MRSNNQSNNPAMVPNLKVSNQVMGHLKANSQVTGHLKANNQVMVPSLKASHPVTEHLKDTDNLKLTGNPQLLGSHKLMANLRATRHTASLRWCNRECSSQDMVITLNSNTKASPNMDNLKGMGSQRKTHMDNNLHGNELADQACLSFV